MTEPEHSTDVDRRMRRLNPTLVALLGGIVILLLLIAYFATSRNSEQDKLAGNAIISNEVTRMISSPDLRWREWKIRWWRVRTARTDR